MIPEPTNDEMRTASPESILQAQKKPSSKAIENLEEWRDSEANNDWNREALDSVIEYLKNEVLE